MLGFADVLLVVPVRAVTPPALSLVKTSSGTVLLGGEVDYHLAATNSSASGAEQYNLSYVDVLPPGVTFVPGSTDPSGFGEPFVTTVTDTTVTPSVSHQVLTWSNVADLTPGSTRILSFKASVDPATFPVGSSVANTASAFSSSDPREVPVISDQGTLVGGVHVADATSSATTAVTALKLSKGEASPEDELLRGVNDHQTTYSLTIDNNRVAASTDVVVVDYLPAGLEFLGCGGPFNSATPEYPGASNAVTSVAGCTAPASVDTVQDPAGYPAGVYTKVTWNVGSLPAGGVRTITYAAGIPQRANTISWSGAQPSAVSGTQAANLDNNNGASTRETDAEQTLTNYATVSGTFQGKPVESSASHSVTAEDLRLVKSVTPSSFIQGELATYTLDVDASEYANLSDLRITDTIPNGLCPIDASTNWTSLSDCAAQAGHGPTNATITQVVSNPDGTFTVTLAPSMTALAHDGHLTITYQALMRATYTSATGNNGSTSANDTFTNHAAITGTSDVRPDAQSPDSGRVTVFDDSSATLTSGGPSLVKMRMANTTPMRCSDNAADYAADVTGSENAFTEGDRVCFLLQVQFPQGVATRSAQLTDFLPANLTYESSKEVSPGGLVSSLSPAAPSQYVTWTLGSGNPQIVPKGALVQIVVSAIVTKPAPLGSGTPQALDKENLAKFRYTNSVGQSDSLRDAVALPVGPPPPIGITKGVQSVGSRVVDAGATPANVDGVTVRDDDLVTFRIDLRNEAKSGDVNGDAITSPDVWDVLPAGITCTQISAISNGGTCYDAGASGRPLLASGDASSSIIRWPLGPSFSLAPQAYGTLTYAMRVPSGASVSTIYANTAAVASYASATNINDGGVVPVAIHNPSANISAGVAVGDQDVPAASDTSSVVLPDASIAKLNTTAITETGNSQAQAVVGEPITYTLRVTIPAHTTVYNGKLVDPLPVGVAFVGPATAAYAADGHLPATQTLPAGVSLDPATGTISFPSAYANTTDIDQVFEVIVPARLGTDASNTQGVVRRNTATFTSDTAPSGGTAVTPRTASSTVTVVAPAPSLAKSVAPTSAVGGDTVTYSLKASNAAGRAPLHDAWVVDCLPSALTFAAFSSVPAGTSVLPAVAGDGTNGCASGYTRISWKVGDLAGGGSATLTYTAVVNAVPAGGDKYVNAATLKGSTLNDGKSDPTAPDNPVEQVLSATSSATITVGAAAVTKSAAQTVLTIGQVGAFSVKVVVPKNVAFYDSAVVDALPAGMTYVAGSAVVSCSYADGSACHVPGTELAPSGSTVGWLIGDLSPAAQARTITVTYSASMNDISGNTAGTNRTNTARFAWNKVDGSDPSGAGASWTATSANAAATVRVVEPALTIAKAVDVSSVEPGQVFHYAVTVSNNGRTTANLSPAYNYTVTDAVPVGVVVDPASLNGGVLSGTDANGSGGTITWGPIAGPLAVNAATSFTYAARLAASSSLTAAPLTNTARVSHDESLPNGGRTSYAQVAATATVRPVFPHVTVTKAAAPGPAYLGLPKTWTITVTNDGPVDAGHVSATDTLPVNWTYDPGSATVVVSGGAASQAEPTVATDGSGRQVLTWSDLGTASATGVKTITITFAATPQDPATVSQPGVGSGVPHTNTVSVTAQDRTGATGSASGQYNSAPATASTHVDSADVEVLKTSGTAIAGKDLTYTLVVSNHGPDQASGPFTVIDTLPTGLGGFSWSGTGWSCALDTTTLSCRRTSAGDVLALGASFPPITVTAAVPASTADGVSLSNTASVDASTYDPDRSNNTDEVTNIVTRLVDLGIVKRSSGVTAGTETTYTLDVTNHGPSDSAGPITVTDTLPSGTNFVSAAGSGWDCSSAGHVLTCTRAEALASGASASSIVLVAKVAPEVAGTLTNTAQVKGPETDPVPANDTATVSDPVTTSADLALTKSHLGTFTPGNQGTYELTVINNGPSDAAAPVTVTDQLAPELTFLSDDSPNWSCAVAAGNLLTCTFDGSLSTGQQRTFRITVGIDAAHTGPVTNSATVSSPTSDPLLGNNTDGDTTGVDVEADLGIVKSHRGDAVAGTSLAFTLSVTNHGQSDSPGPITVHDTLPSGMTFVAATGPGWNCSTTGQDVSCTHAGGLHAKETANAITLTVAVASGVGPTILTNSASVAGEAPDPNPANNTSTDEVTVTERANIAVTKSADVSDVKAGQDVTWAMTVRNQGPSDARNVQLTDQLPVGLQYLGVEAGQGISCDDANPIACRVTSLGAGASFQVRVRTRVGSGVADGTTITNTSHVSTSTDGDDPDDNASTAGVAVTTAADLVIVKTHPDTPAVAGGQMSFSLDVGNDGPSDATAPVVVTDTLPVGMTYVSSAGTGWSCVASAAAPAGQSVTCTLDDGVGVLAGTRAPVLTMLVQLDSDVDPEALPSGVLVNTATVTSPTVDPVPGNNTAHDPVTVVASADLSIVKSHAETARVGDPLTFTLAVANHGPSTAREVVVSDPLPVGMTLVSAEGEGWSCSSSAQVVTCASGSSLASGQTASPIHVTARVLPSAYPGVTNTAVVASVTPDPDRGNNTASDPVAVPPLVDLAVTKRHAPEPAQVGQQVTYTIDVSNAGPTPDPGPITVTDSLPTGLSYVRAVGDGWVCEASGAQVTCVRTGGLSSSATSSIALVVEVGPEAYPSVVNVASVSSPAEDTVPANNTASDPTAILPLYDLVVAKKVHSITPTSADWLITVSNTGPNEAPTGALVTDDLPDGLGYVGYDGEGWTCSASGARVTCLHADAIGAKDSTSVVLHTSIAANAPHTIVNTARVEGGNSDTATAVVPIAGADLAATGGAPLPVLWFGLIMIGLGLVLVRARRRDRTG